MSTVFSDISAALDSQLNTLSGSSPIAWQNTVFKPAKSNLYLRPSLLPVSSAQIGLGSAGLDQHTGIYQVDVYAPSGNGRSQAEVKADSVADHFKRGTDLSYNGVTVRLGDTSRNQGLMVDDRFVISVSINYSAHVAPR